MDLQAFYDDMTSTYEFQTLQAFSGEILDSYYPGMSEVDTKQCLIMGTMMSMNNGEFCLVEVSNSSRRGDGQAISRAGWTIWPRVVPGTRPTVL